MKIAIIGAGMAGLTAARTLAASGHEIAVFDKGRGPGGRMSTRRANTPIGEMRFDHGAQHFSPKEPGFAAVVDEWVKAGAAALWDGTFITVAADGTVHPAAEKPRYVGTPSMNAIIRHMAEDLPVDWGRRASVIEGRAGDYSVIFEDGGREGPFEAVLVAVPLEQVGALLTPVAPSLAAHAEGLESDPCWAVMLAFDAPLEAPFDAARYDSGPLAWAARNGSKPGRGGAETWVLHASAETSLAHLEEHPDAVASLLTEAFAPPMDPVFASAHRWRFSQVKQSAGIDALWDADRQIGACGDWLTGRQIENAWASGLALAETIL